MPRSQDHEKRPTAGREQSVDVPKKTHLYIVIYAVDIKLVVSGVAFDGNALGPHLRRGVRAGSLRAPEPRAREKTLDRKRKKMPMCKKTHLYMVI